MYYTIDRIFCQEEILFFLVTIVSFLCRFGIVCMRSERMIQGDSAEFAEGVKSPDRVSEGRKHTRRLRQIPLFLSGTKERRKSDFRLISPQGSASKILINLTNPLQN